ncbi:MAG: hypothetical protein MRY72_12255 [Aquisalinus sp.]|nr:hypothetical protein [Aquisalinus sp.]
MAKLKYTISTEMTGEIEVPDEIYEQAAKQLASDDPDYSDVDQWIKQNVNLNLANVHDSTLEVIDLDLV